MQKWKYMFIELMKGKNSQTNFTQELLDHLNTLGTDGWEVVGFSPYSSLDGPPQLTNILLKREVGP